MSDLIKISNISKSFDNFKKIKVLKNYYRADIGHEDGLLFSKVYFDDYKLS